MPPGRREGYAQHDGNPPRRDIQPALDCGHIGVGCESPGRNIRDKVALIHHAEQKQEKSEQPPSMIFGSGVEVSRQQVEEAIAK